MLPRSLLLSTVFWLAFAGVLRATVVSPESCGDTSPAAIRTAALNAAAWLAGNQLPDGRYTYLYDRDGDTTPADYNEVRHAGVTLALYQAAGRLDDAAAFTAAEAGLGWMIDNLRGEADWRALAPYDGAAGLGATALMTVALAERRLATGDHQYDELMRQLGRFIVAMQREDGGFYVFWLFGTHQPDRVSTSRYYPGESLWALALLAEAFPDAGWDAPARRALAFLVDRRDDVEHVTFQPLPDQWLAYGLAEMVEWGLSDGDVAQARRLAGRFGFLVRTESQRQGSRVGELVHGGKVRSAGFGTWLEGLDSLWRVAATDDRLADLAPKLRERAACGAGIMAARQTTAAAASRLPRPGLAAGAWFTDGVTRMDDQQHALSGLIYALDAIDGRTQRAPDTPIVPSTP